MLVLVEGGVVGNVADGSIAQRKSDDYQSVSVHGHAASS
jgi:hypothetical protein